MSGWIDSIGTRALVRYIQQQQKRMEALADRTDRIHPKSRRAARYRARHDELSYLMMLVQAVTRPGSELRPYKELVNQGTDERREKIRHLVPVI